MNLDALLKKKQVLDGQLQKLKETLKLGLLTKHEFSLAKKRLDKQLKGVNSELKTKEAKSKIVKELLEGKTVQKKPSLQKKPLQKKTLAKKKKGVPMKKVVSRSSNVQRLAERKEDTQKSDAVLEEIKKMRVQDVKEKTEVLKKQNELEKKEEVAAILADIGKVKVSSEQKVKDPVISFGDKHTSIDEIYGKPDESSKWKIALTLLGIFLVVLLYMKFSSTTVVGDNVFVTIYGDYSCEPCAEVHETFNSLQEVYGNRLVLLYKHLPLTEDGMFGAQAAECAADQGDFLPYHDLLFKGVASGRELSKTALILYATQVELDIELFEKCLDSEIKRPLIEKEKKNSIADGIDALPMAIIQNQKKIVGVFPQGVYVREINAFFDGIEVTSD